MEGLMGKVLFDRMGWEMKVLTMTRVLGGGQVLIKGVVALN